MSRRFFAAVAMVLGGFSMPAFALTSDWVKHEHGQTRLIAAYVKPVGDGVVTLSGAIHHQLDSGWKTYWKNPGDAGISLSLIGEKVPNLSWPAPQRLVDKTGLQSFVYSGEVVIPFELTTISTEEELPLFYKAQFMVCQAQCIPVEASVALTIPAKFKEASDEKALSLFEQAKKRVPNPDDKAFSIASYEWKADPAGAAIVMEITTSKDLSSGDVFIEGGESYRFAAPKILRSEKGFQVMIPATPQLKTSTPPLEVTAVVVGKDAVGAYKLSFSSIR